MWDQGKKVIVMRNNNDWLLTTADLTGIQAVHISFPFPLYNVQCNAIQKQPGCKKRKAKLETPFNV